MNPETKFVGGAIVGANDILATVGVATGGTAVYYIDSADNALIAGEFTLIAHLDGVTTADLVFNNFTVTA